MSFRNSFFHAVNKLAGNQRKISQFEFSGHAPEPSELEGLEALFWNNSKPLVHKWLHYLPIYERHLSQLRSTPLKFLEIGVSKGGSMKMWRDYFGDDATIFGIDIDPKCVEFDGQAGQVRIGSQADRAFLESVVDEMGGVDVILDDGSHDSHHIRASFRELFPKVSEGGLYLIEDLHCAYWPKWSGGYRRKSSFMFDIKQMADDMHHWYHGRGEKIEAAAGHLAGMHIYDSIAVFEKRAVARPVHAQVGYE